jgi:hypothetical protein
MASCRRSNVSSTENGLGLLTMPSTEGGVPDFVGWFMILSYLLNIGSGKRYFRGFFGASVYHRACGRLILWSQLTVKQVLRQSRSQINKAEISINRHCQVKNLAVFAGHRSSARDEFQ